jgi:hypothetical protein
VLNVFTMAWSRRGTPPVYWRRGQACARFARRALDCLATSSDRGAGTVVRLTGDGARNRPLSQGRAVLVRERVTQDSAHHEAAGTQPTTSCTPIDWCDSLQVVEQQAGQELPSRSLACIVRIECQESTVFRAILCHESLVPVRKSLTIV